MKDVHKTLLLVEDDTVTAHDSRLALEKFGYTVIISHSGEGAINIVTSNNTVNLVLMDIDLGTGIDGTETARRILAYKLIPIVFLTTHGERKMVEKVRNITRYGYVIKNSGDFVLQSSIEMAFELFEAHMRTRASELRNRSIVSALPDLLFIINKDGIFLDCQTNNPEMLLLPPEEFLGKKAAEVLPGYLAELTMGKLDKTLSQKKSQIYSYYTFVDNIRHDYETRMVLHGANEVLVIIRDITDRIKAEKTNKRIWDMATEMICVADIYTATFVKVNPAFYRILGYTEEELISQPFNTFIHPDDIEKTDRVVTEQLQKGADVISFENRYRCKDGSYKILEWNSHPVLEDGVTYAIAHDITERRDTEKKLDTKNRLLNSLLENLPIGVYMIEAPGGRPLLANRKAVELLGRGIMPEVNRNTIGEVYHAYIAGTEELYPPHEMPIIRGMSGDECYVDNMELHKPDGSRILIEVYGSPVYDQQGTITASIAMFIEITEEKAALKALQDSERKFKALISKMDQGLAVFKAVYNKSGEVIDGIYIEANESYERLTGVKREDVLGRSALSVLPHAELQWIQKFGNAAKSGKVYHVERYIEGLRRYFDITSYRPQAGQFALILADITERKQGQIKQRGEKEVLEKLLSTSPIGIITVNRDGLISYANTHAEKILALSKKGETELSYNNPKWLITAINGNDFPEENLPFSVVKKTLQPVYNIQHAIADSENRKTMLSINAAPLFDNSGNFDGMISTIQDITESITTQNKIRSLLSEKELLLKEVHHRIKNNMNIITGLLTLQADSTENKDAKSILTNASSRIQSMQILYNQLYRMEHINESSMKLYLEQLLDEISSNYSTDTQVTFQIDLEDIYLDTKRLSTIGIIVNELITNSFKYAFKEQNKGTISVSAHKAKEAIQLSIGDNGIGCNTDPEIKRKGFGLKLVYLLTEQLQGTLLVKTSEGTVYTLQFAE